MSGTPAVSKKASERDAVVDEEQPDDLRDGLSARDEEEEAEQHRRQCRSARGVSRRWATRAVSFPLTEECDDDSVAAATSEAETLTNGAASRLLGIATDESAEQRRDDDAFGNKDESGDDPETSIVLVRGEHAGDDAERDALDGEVRRRSPRRSLSPQRDDAADEHRARSEIERLDVGRRAHRGHESGHDGQARQARILPRGARGHERVGAWPCGLRAATMATAIDGHFGAERDRRRSRRGQGPVEVAMPHGTKRFADEREEEPEPHRLRRA